jgi:cytochrome c-type biogenesis protein CcmH/NrfG
MKFLLSAALYVSFISLIFAAPVPQSGYNNPQYEGDPSNASTFNQMLSQYNQLQQQTMLENMEMQKAQAYWTPNKFKA